MTRILLVAVFVAASLVSVGSARPATGAHCYASVRVDGSVYSGTVTRSVRTSCPFARNVLRASLRTIVRAGGAGDGDFYTFAWSPVTRRWYHVRCVADGDLRSTSGVHVDCRAGIGARVLYRAWSR